jgi:hypothetical protein
VLILRLNCQFAGEAKEALAFEFVVNKAIAKL